MTDSVRLGRLLGIPIGLHWGALVIAAVFTLNLATNALPQLAPEAPLSTRLAVGVAGVIVFFASILAHELGHAVVALRHGIEVSGVTLWVLGGVAKLERHAESARAEFQVAVAGPVTSAVLGVFFAALAVIVNATVDVPLLLAVVAWLAGVNLVLAVFNLLPGAPLDGGRILTAWLWHRSGDANEARLVAGRCGLVLAGVLAVFGLWAVTAFGPVAGVVNLAVAAMVFFAASAEIRGAYLATRLETPIDRLHLRHPRPVPADTTLVAYDQLLPSIDGDLAHPVVHHDITPIGYIGPAASAVTQPARSWTTVGEVMHPVEDVPVIGADRAARELIELWSDTSVAVAVTYDAKGRAVGTITDEQLRPLFQRPTRWGLERDRNQTMRPADGPPPPSATPPPPPPSRGRQVAAPTAPPVH
ncbi:MAG: site-2 protease family protein [Actinomycetota bacterium]